MLYTCIYIYIIHCILFCVFSDEVNRRKIARNAKDVGKGQLYTSAQQITDQCLRDVVGNQPEMLLGETTILIIYSLIAMIMSYFLSFCETMYYISSYINIIFFPHMYVLGLGAVRNIAYSVNRARKEMRPDEPDNLDFALDYEFIGRDFIKGDVRVGNKRHIILASDQMLTKMSTCNHL